MNNDPQNPTPHPEPVAEPSETTGEVAPPAEATPSEPASTESTTTVKQPKAVKPRTSRKKVTIVIAVVIALLVAAAVGYWYFVARKTSAPVTTTSSPAAPAAEHSNVFKPSRIMYTQGAEAGTNLMTIPFMGGQSTAVSGIDSPGQTNIHENLVVTTSLTSSPGQETSALYLSTNSAQTFSEIFKQTSATNNSSLALAITSAVISSDGKQVIFALMNKQNGNTVKSYDIATKTVTDLFTVDRIGVFLQGFDSQAKKAYYFTGCFYCDGVTYNTLYVYDWAAKSQTEVYNTPSQIGVSLQFNQDLSKAVIVQGANSSSGLGAGAPYTAKELTLSTKAFTDIATSTSGNPLAAGYTSDYKSIYYSEGNNIYSVNSSGKKVLAFQADQPIYEIYYVGTDYVITSVGNVVGDTGSAAPKVAVLTFDVAANKATTVLTTTSAERGLGVSLTNQ